MKQSAAFTLLELSIVIVVIALIIGGVLVGRDLISSAQSRALMKDFEKIQVAASTFKLKYSCIAGDCRNATTLGLGTNGNGNTLLGSNTTATDGDCLTTYDEGCLTINATTSSLIIHNRIYGEQQYFWQHLSNAKLIQDEITAIPFSATAVTADSMSPYFPKDSFGKAYLTTFMWGGKIFVRTGMSELANYKQGQMTIPVLTSAQMSQIFSKFSHNIIIDTNDYLSLFTGQKVLPLGVSSNPRHLRMATDASLAGWGTACVVSDGEGGYKFNIQNNGRCNIMWELTP